MKALQLRTFITLIFFSLVIFFLDGRGLLDGPKGIVQTVTVPVQYSLYSAKLGLEEVFSFLTFWKSGEKRIKNLEQKNLELLAGENKAKATEEENIILRKQLGVNPKPATRLLPATVLGTLRYLEIGVGGNDGVAEGMAVIYLNNLLGRVEKVTPKASFVVLLSDPQSKVPVKVGSARGLVSGQFNSSMVLDHIAQTEEISDTNPVLTSGEGESLPPDLVVGKVGKITSVETDLFQKAEVISLVDVNKLTTVFVVQ